MYVDFDYKSINKDGKVVIDRDYGFIVRNMGTGFILSDSAESMKSPRKHERCSVVNWNVR